MSNNTWTLPVHLLPPVTVNKDQHYSPAGTLVTTGNQLLPFRYHFAYHFSTEKWFYVLPKHDSSTSFFVILVTERSNRLSTKEPSLNIPTSLLLMLT